MFTIKDIPSRYRPMYKRAMSGKSFKAAIRSHCLMCMGWDEADAGIRDCTMKECPLFPYRFLRSTQKA